MRTIQWMLLGISIMLIGGFILLDPSSGLEGFEFFMIFGGFIVTLISFLVNKDK